MKTMQMMKESKDRACVQTWHQDSWADFREISTGFSQDDIFKLSQEKGAA